LTIDDGIEVCEYCKISHRIEHMITYSGYEKIGAGSSIFILNEKATNVKLTEHNGKLHSK